MRGEHWLALSDALRAARTNRGGSKRSPGSQLLVALTAQESRCTVSVSSSRPALSWSGLEPVPIQRIAARAGSRPSIPSYDAHLLALTLACLGYFDQARLRGWTKRCRRHAGSDMLIRLRSSLARLCDLELDWISGSPLLERATELLTASDRSTVFRFIAGWAQASTADQSSVGLGTSTGRPCTAHRRRWPHTVPPARLWGCRASSVACGWPTETREAD